MVHLGRKAVLRAHRILIRITCGARFPSQAPLIYESPRRLVVFIPSCIHAEKPYSPIAPLVCSYFVQLPGGAAR